MFLRFFDTVCDSCCPPGAWRSSSAQMFFVFLGNAVVLRKFVFTVGPDPGVPVLLGQWLVLGFSFLLFLRFCSLGLTVSFSINSAQM